MRIEGPQFFQPSRLNWHRSIGGVIGMTNMPEAKLARRRRLPTPRWHW
jgi:purine nucleoside phosphorylase